MEKLFRKVFRKKSFRETAQKGAVANEIAIYYNSRKFWGATVVYFMANGPAL